MQSDRIDNSELRHRNSESGIAISEEEVDIAVDASSTTTPNSHNNCNITPPSIGLRQPPRSNHSCVLCCRFRAELTEVAAEGRADFADILSRLLFPLTFFIFNLFYWTLYLYVL